MIMKVACSIMDIDFKYQLAYSVNSYVYYTYTFLHEFGKPITEKCIEIYTSALSLSLKHFATHSYTEKYE